MNLLRSKRSLRDEEGVFVLEGAREIERALANKIKVIELFVCEELLSPLAKSIVVKTQTEKIPVSAPVFAKLVMREKSDGICALAKQNYLTVDTISSILKKPAFLVYVQHVEKPGNLGAIFRSADGAGVDAVFLSQAFNDPFNPNALRASIGSICSMAKVQMPFADFAQYCRKNGIALLASSPSATKTIYEVDMAQPIALVLGSEATGMEEDDMQIADQLVKIPMLGLNDSLNVSVSAGVMFYEVCRQRRYSRSPR